MPSPPVLDHQPRLLTSQTAVHNNRTVCQMGVGARWVGTPGVASVFVPALGWMVGGFPCGHTLTYAHSMLDRCRQPRSHSLGGGEPGVMLWARSRRPLNRLDVVPGSWSTEPSNWESDSSELFVASVVLDQGGGRRWACHVAVTSTRFRVGAMTDRPAATARVQRSGW